MPKVKLVRRATFDNPFVMVDGLTRTGKSMLGPILASFERVEIERVEEKFEFVGGLARLGLLNRHAAISLLRLDADILLYNGLIGRNTNFRYGDHSGVMNYPSPRVYYERLTQPEGQDVVRRIQEGKPIFQNQTHDQLMNFRLFHDAFGSRLRMIQMLRHPVDLIDSWYRRGWGTRFGNDPTAFTHCIEFEGQDLPYYAAGWEHEYRRASSIGRVVRMIARLMSACRDEYKMLTQTQRGQIYFLRYDDFVVDPWPYVESVAGFLGTVVSDFTTDTVRRERCPRPAPTEKRAELSGRILSQLDSYEVVLVRDLQQHYEAMVSGIALPFHTVPVTAVQAA